MRPKVYLHWLRKYIQAKAAHIKRQGISSLSAPTRYAVHVVDGLLLFLALVTGIAWLTFVFLLMQNPPPVQVTDFLIYYAAATALRANPAVDIYNQSILQQAVAHAGCPAPHLASYLYPPFLAFVMEPLTWLPCTESAWLWQGLNILIWLACALFLARWLRSTWLPPGFAPQARRLRAVVALLFFSSFPLAIALGLGQIDIFILLLLLMIPRFVQKKQFLLAGALLAVVAMIKIIPALLIFYYVARRQWQVVICALASLVILAGLTIGILGPAGIVAVAAWYLAGQSDTVMTPHNEAFAQLPAWLTISAGGKPDHTTVLLTHLLIGAVLALFFSLLFLLIWRVRPKDLPGELAISPRQAETTDILGYGWALCTMLLISPLVWFHYNGWLLLPLAFCIGYVLCLVGVRRRSGIYTLGLLVIAAFLIAFPLPFNMDTVGFHAQTPVVAGVPLWFLLMLTRPVGTWLLWGVTLYLFLASRVTQDGSLPELSP